MEAAATVTTDERASEATQKRTYYGWWMIAVTAMAAVATSPGQSFLIGLFNTPLREAAGVDVDALSVAYMLGTFASATLLTYVGHWSDRRGPRLLAGLATIGLGLACAYFALGLATSFVTLALGFFLLRFFGQGCLSIASTHALALWWDRRLGFAESLRLAAFAVGTMVLPAIVTFLLLRLGHRGTFAIMGATTWAVMLPVVWLLWRNRPADVGQRFVDRRAHPEQTAGTDVGGLTLPAALRSYAYWGQAAVVAYFAALGTAMLFHARPILEAAGHDQERAATLAATGVTTWAACGFLFHFVGGQLVDRLPAGPLLAGVAAVLGLAGATLANADSAWLAVTAFGLLGVGHGVITTIGSPILVRHFGRRSLGAIKGSFSTLGVGASGAGPAAVALMASVAADETPRFDLALWICAATAVPLVAAAAFLRRPAWSTATAATL